MSHNGLQEKRRDLFYKGLYRGHILILRVINDTLSDSYKLLVLCKQENHMKLDDLSIVVYLPKLPAELELAGGELKANDIIKAAVCSLSICERKLYVTLDSSILGEGAENVSLGKISEKDLPFYIGKTTDSMTSTTELRKKEMEALSNSDYIKGLRYYDRGYYHATLFYFNKALAKNPKNVDALVLRGTLKRTDSMTSTTELRRKEMEALSNSDYIKGLRYYDKGYYHAALFFFNIALAKNPKNVDALVLRGTLHLKKKNILGAFKDMELALDIDSKHEKACKEMSNILVSIAKLYIQHQNPEKAKEVLDCALGLDSTKKDAVAVYDEIQKMVATARFPKQTSGSGKNMQRKSQDHEKDKISHHHCSTITNHDQNLLKLILHLEYMLILFNSFSNFNKIF